MTTPNRVVMSNGVTVGASLTAVPVSYATRLTDEQRRNIRVQVVLSAVTRTSAALKARLQHSFDGSDWYYVGDQADVTVPASIVCASATDIANATEIFTETSHGLATGDPLIFKAGTAAPAGLTDGTTYYMIKVDANSFKLASTQENAYAGTAVAITTDGTGNQTFSKALHEIRMVYSDTSDIVQLPLYPLARVVIDSSTSDSITVSKVYFA